MKYSLMLCFRYNLENDFNFKMYLLSYYYYLILECNIYIINTLILFSIEKTIQLLNWNYFINIK